MMIIRRLLLLAIWFLAATDAFAANPSFVQWQFSNTGGNPQSVQFRDRGGTWITLGQVDSSVHTFTIAGGLSFACATMPPLSGNITSPAGSCVTTIAAGVVTGTMIGATTITAANIAASTITGAKVATNTLANTNLSQMATMTVKGNVTGGTANAADLTGGQVGQILCDPIVQVINSAGGSTGTYTTPTCNGITAQSLEAEFVAAGGGGGGTGSSGNTNGGNGGVSSFGTSLFSATGGTGGLKSSGSVTAGGAPGVGSGCLENLSGTSGGGFQGIIIGLGAPGGSSVKWGLGGTPAGGGMAGNNGLYGGGGGGGAGSSSVIPAAGAGGGGYCHGFIALPAATYLYVQGAGGVAGAAGTSGFAGGIGGDGYIFITARWQ